jgi:hypothetical protein
MKKYLYVRYRQLNLRRNQGMMGLLFPKDLQEHKSYLPCGEVWMDGSPTKDADVFWEEVVQDCGVRHLFCLSRLLLLVLLGKIDEALARTQVGSHMQRNHLEGYIFVVVIGLVERGRKELRAFTTWQKALTPLSVLPQRE